VIPPSPVRFRATQAAPPSSDAEPVPSRCRLSPAPPARLLPSVKLWAVSKIERAVESGPRFNDTCRLSSGKWRSRPALDRRCQAPYASAPCRSTRAC
jgi:hypothetical protein